MVGRKGPLPPRFPQRPSVSTSAQARTETMSTAQAFPGRFLPQWVSCPVLTPIPRRAGLGLHRRHANWDGQAGGGVPRPIWGGPDPKEGERSQSPGVPEGVTGQRWGLGPGLRSSPSPAPGRQLPLLPGRRPPSPPPRVNPEMTVLVSSLPPAPAAPTSEEAQEEGKPGKRGPAPAPTSTLSAAPPVCARPLRTCRVLLA